LIELLDCGRAVHRGEHVLYGSVLILAAATQNWAANTDSSVAELARTALH